MGFLLLAVFAAAAPAPPPAEAGVYFEQTTVVLVDGQPAGPGVVSRVWYGGRRMRLEAPTGAALVLRLDEGRGFRVDPVTRRVTPVDLEAMRTRAHLDTALAGDLMGAGVEPRTARLRGTRTLAGRPCRGYRLSAGSATLEVWMAEGLGADVGTFHEFLEWSGASVALGPLVGALRALPGFPLQTRSRVTILDDVQETVSTVTRVEVAAPPPGTFDPPKGFRVEGKAR